MNQPSWEYTANLGDADPIGCGGLFVYIDKTGAYPPEIEVIDVRENEGYDSDYDQDYEEHKKYDEDKSEELHWTIYRVVLDRCTYDAETECLSDNKFHPQHSVWFSQTRKEREERPQDSGLESICSCCDIERDELIRLLCSDDPIELARGYMCIGDVYGWHEFDQYPLEIKSRKEMDERYADEIKSKL